ncbi:hypothetical protein CDAR_277611 [Caerostris darwini]|uniref:Uncharacterized protein n=1 Tax=Caerostris darwini TaxID=1538125 RepID=A0AAV4PEV1_9ARAC|nr:hypothetical protein CDAR_277611 [Caerostris darwini]
MTESMRKLATHKSIIFKSITTIFDNQTARPFHPKTKLIPYRILTKEHSVHLEDPRELEESEYKSTGDTIFERIFESNVTRYSHRVFSHNVAFEVICAKTGTITPIHLCPVFDLRSLVPRVHRF